MPNFPRYNSQADMTTQQPAHLLTSETLPAVSRQAEITQQRGEIGKQVADIALKLDAGIMSTRKTVAEVNSADAIADIHQRAANDPNPDNQKNYIKELDQARQKNTQGLDRLSALQINHDYNNAGIQLDNIFTKKNLEIDAIATQKRAEQLANEGKFKEITDLFQEKADTGHMDKSTAYSLEKTYIKKAKDTQIGLEIANDSAREESQSQVLAELKKGDSGKYSYLAVDERLDAIKASQQRIFNNNQTYKRDIEDSQNERQNSLIDKMANQEINIHDIEDEESVPEEAGGMKRTQLLTYKKAVLTGIKGNLDRMLQEKTNKEPTKRAQAVKQYNDLIENFMDDKSDQWKAKEMLANAYADGIVNSREQKFLNDLKQDLKDIDFNRNTSVIVGAMRGLKDFLHLQTNASDEVIALKMKQLVGGISSGQEAPDMVKQIMDQTMHETLTKAGINLSKISDKGQLIRDKKGNVIRFYPDGTYEAVPSTKSNAKAK